MKTSQAPIGAVALGVLLLLLSWLWPSLVGGAGAYSEKDRQEFEQARSNLLETMHSHAGGESENEHSEQTQQAAQAAFDTAVKRRDEAFNRGQSTAVVLRWSGVVVVLLGAVAHFAMRAQ